MFLNYSLFLLYNEFVKRGIMIITKTPFRIDFAGDGTDLPSFYEKEFGCVTSVSIKKYVYITAHKSFDNTITLKYSQHEKVNDVEELKNERAREALKLTGVRKGIEIHSVADMPAQTGLGSSSSFVVGMLNALYAYNQKLASADRLAREAFEIEVLKLGNPIGKQDHYAAAYGGLNYLQFNSDNSVGVRPIIMAKNMRNELQKNLIMFYTGFLRSASDILAGQKKDIETNKEKFAYMQRMRDIGVEMRDSLLAGDLMSFAELLDKNWQYKKQMNPSVTNPQIDKWYTLAKEHGALGGKISGAGAGGFLVVYCEEEKQDKLIRALPELKPYPVEFEPEGSKIIYVHE